MSTHHDLRGDAPAAGAVRRVWQRSL